MFWSRDKLSIFSALIDIGPHWDLATYLLYVFIGIVYGILFRESVQLKRRGNKEHRLALLAAAGWLFIFLGFRSITVGADTDTYVTWFQNATTLDIDWMKALTFQSSVEPIYQIFQFLLRQLGDNPLIFTCGEALVISISLTYFFSTFITSTEMTLPLVLVSVYFEFAASIARSAIGMCLVLVGFVMLAKNRHVLAVGAAIIATYTHNTLAIFLPLFIAIPLFAKSHVYRRGTLFVVGTIAIILVNFISYYVYNTLINQTRYSYYADSGTSITLLSSWNIVLLGIVLGVQLFRNRLSEISNVDKIMVFAFIYEIITLPFVFISGFWRMSLYLVPIRTVVWGVMLRETCKAINDGRCVFLIKYFMSIMLQLYILFYLSRESYYAGFIYSMF